MKQLLAKPSANIIFKSQNVGMTTSLLPLSQYKIEEGGKLYVVAEYAGNDTFWFFNEKLHRESGPAALWGNGTKEWYFCGEKIQCQSQEEFEKLLKLKAFW